jgi:glucose-1-phosphate thymidylyltransferase
VKALILAAGYATRLYPLTRYYPKPLLEVKGRPIIDYIVDKLNDASCVDEIIVVTNSRFISRFKSWKKARKLLKPITLVDDLTKSNDDRRGAIGDVNFVINKLKIKDDLLVVGGDNLFSGGLNNFLAAALKKKPCATIGLYKLNCLKDASRYGVVKLNRSSKVVEFNEKPAKPNSHLVAMCLYYIPSECLKLICDFIRVSRKSDATGNYIDWLKDRVATYGFIFKGCWYDIGDFKYLNAAKTCFAEKKGRSNVGA